jgi:hypothetical protein
MIRSSLLLPLAVALLAFSLSQARDPYFFTAAELTRSFIRDAFIRDAASSIHPSVPRGGSGDPLLDSFSSFSASRRADPRYSTVAVDRFRLPCSLPKFLSTFLADGAPRSVPLFHEEDGDEDVAASAWSAPDGEGVRRRAVSFVHPLSNPLGPARTRVEKAQTQRVYGAHGAVLETSTRVLDVPGSKVFTVEVKRVRTPSSAPPSLTPPFRTAGSCARCPGGGRWRSRS